ncbi:hypothetical protein EHS89_10190 [Amphritea balenae]|uniref:CheW-like domain-containing protein n=1 Tax=Amphritea balenae TaxID=452629 RepID=A0A3P1SQG1_9GAMM|nr:hypothetical protein EHS89_10190 [Amphritea balenae]
MPIKYLQGARYLNALSLDISGGADWVLGSYEDGGLNNLVIDTGLWIIPERYEHDLAGYEQIVKLRDSNKALAIDSMEGSQVIEESQITWNNNPKNRPWLLGTCMKFQCAVVNIPALLQSLDNAPEMA